MPPHKFFISALLIALATCLSMNGSSARLFSDPPLSMAAASELPMTDIQAVPKPSYSIVFGWLPIPRWPVINKELPIVAALSRGAPGPSPSISTTMPPISATIASNPPISGMISSVPVQLGSDAPRTAFQPPQLPKH